MSDKSHAESGDSEVFDVERLRELVELMKEHDLSEVDLRQSSNRIRVRRGQEPGLVMPSLPAVSNPAVTAGETAAAAPPADDDATFITSPMVGTFYTSPKPDAPPFVKVGDHVDPDTIVCMVEAMKMFNEIPAGVSGKIASVVAKNEEPVDVGKQLFKVIPG